MGIGRHWDVAAHRAWENGERPRAIAAVTGALQAGPNADHALQLAYYLFLEREWAKGRIVLEEAATAFPDRLDVLLNLAVFQAKSRDPAATRASLERYMDLGGTDSAALDGLAKACHDLGDDVSAARWGTLAIEAKSPKPAAPLPMGKRRRRGRRIISFSLWGDHPRYLRGALWNAVRAPEIYPHFLLRYYVDDSVPADLVDALATLGAQIVRDPGEPDLRRRLTRRFLVADDPDVATFLCRDCDSVFSKREARAVAEWLASELPFHVMRDWWSHTDPILAGMWGGHAGVLPPIGPMIESYRSGMLETPSWDQWFLRDAVWPSIRPITLVHDRCFKPKGARPFPGDSPGGTFHVGQNEWVSRPGDQAMALMPFLLSVPSLKF